MNRETMISMWLSNPRYLAEELAILLHPYTDDDFRIQHNLLVGKIAMACGKKTDKGRTLDCVVDIAQELADAVIRRIEK